MCSGREGAQLGREDVGGLGGGHAEHLVVPADGGDAHSGATWIRAACRLPDQQFARGDAGARLKVLSVNFVSFSLVSQKVAVAFI